MQVSMFVCRVWGTHRDTRVQENTPTDMQVCRELHLFQELNSSSVRQAQLSTRGSE